jgi:hypothetical protein
MDTDIQPTTPSLGTVTATLIIGGTTAMNGASITGGGITITTSGASTIGVITGGIMTTMIGRAADAGVIGDDHGNVNRDAHAATRA